ncbi:hypothetical protein L195_g006783 [Trifolium pratense]|uniref:Uncharacterized protein n=1 Tax=Trifolium pratense TaxID=57577 RepID=A0A2K3P4M3_TRIPR|nr:hypothetical protein L195_g006783 [Trifolium pratense]
MAADSSSSKPASVLDLSSAHSESHHHHQLVKCSTFTDDGAAVDSVKATVRPKHGKEIKSAVTMSEHNSDFDFDSSSSNSATHHLVECPSSTTDGGVIKAVVEASKTWNYQTSLSEEETKYGDVECGGDLNDDKEEHEEEAIKAFSICWI